MIKRLFLAALTCHLLTHNIVSAHCQMPCGIYHDEMVFDQVDQYVETMVKGISVLQEIKYQNVQDHNVSTRWIMLKEKASDEMAHLITDYFLQQKIKPDEEDTPKRLASAHKMLFYLVQIKQMVDLRVLNDFYEEWEKFKLMFHIEGYKCKVSQVKLQKWKEKQTQGGGGQSASNESHTHDHTHDHDHDHDHDH